MNKKNIAIWILIIGIFIYLNPLLYVYVFVFAERNITDNYDGLAIQILNDGTVLYKDEKFSATQVVLENLLCYYVYENKIIFCKYNYLFNGTYNYEYLVYHKDDHTFSTYYSDGELLHTEKGFKLITSDDVHFKEDAYDIQLPGKWVLLSPVHNPH